MTEKIPTLGKLAREEAREMQSYLDREIKNRLERGEDHATIAASCKVSEVYVERLASGAT